MKAKTKTTNATLQAISIEDVRINKVWYTSGKITRFSIDIIEVSPNGKDIHTFVNCVWFNPSAELEEGDIISLTGSLFYDKYESKKNGVVYTLSLKVGDING